MRGHGIISLKSDNDGPGNGESAYVYQYFRIYVIKYKVMVVNEKDVALWVIS